MKTTSHRLNLTKNGLERFAIHLGSRSIMQSTPEVGKQQFYMPDGKTVVQIRQGSEDTYADITTTGLIGPAYARSLRKELGKECGISSGPDNPNLREIYKMIRREE